MRSCAEPPRNTTWVAPSSSAARSTPDGSGRGWNARLARTTYSACASIRMPKQPCRNSCRKMSVPIRSRCSTSRTTRSRFSRRRIGTRRLPPANYAWTSFRFTAKYCSGHSLIAATVAETYNELLRCRRLPGLRAAFVTPASFGTTARMPYPGRSNGERSSPALAKLASFVQNG